MCKNAGCERPRVVSILDPKIVHAYCGTCERQLMSTGTLPEIRRQPAWMRRDLSRDMTGSAA